MSENYKKHLIKFVYYKTIMQKNLNKKEIFYFTSSMVNNISRCIRHWQLKILSSITKVLDDKEIYKFFQIFIYLFHNVFYCYMYCKGY